MRRGRRSAAGSPGSARRAGETARGEGGCGGSAGVRFGAGAAGGETAPDRDEMEADRDEREEDRDEKVADRD